MLLFSKVGKITPANNKTNIKHDFDVPNGIKKLVVKYKYNPKTVENRADALALINQGLTKYNALFINPEKVMPVKNLVTLSFDENGEYRGACHRQPNEQTVIIAACDSTPGIINKSVDSGKWDIVLNIHFAGCEIDYEIEIEGESE